MDITVTAVPHSSGTLWMRRYSVAFLANHESNTALMASRSCSRTSSGNGRARPLADDALEDVGQLSELGGRHLGIALDAETRLRRVELGVEDLAPHAEDDVAEHHDEAPVAVPRESLVAGARRQTLDGRVVRDRD